MVIVTCPCGVRAEFDGHAPDRLAEVQRLVDFIMEHQSHVDDERAAACERREREQWAN